jgi:hypothetical protein
MESKLHAKDWLIFPENLGKRLSIDETALFQWRTLYYFDQQSKRKEEQ